MAKIRHLVFNTTDPERLAKFYVETLGLRIVHRAKNGGISLTDGYLNFSIHTNKMDGKPSGFNHFGFVIDDAEEAVEQFRAHGYRVPAVGVVDDVVADRGRDMHGIVQRLGQ